MTANSTVLLIDAQEISRLLHRSVLQQEGYRLVEAATPGKAWELLAEHNLDLIVLDLAMREVSGWEFCRALKADLRTRLIPTLVLTSIQGLETQLTGILAGAADVMLKPVNHQLFKAKVHAMLEQKAAIDGLEEAETILFTLAQAVEQRDKCTGDHCERLATLSVALGERLKLPVTELQALHRAGYLHDLGKIAVPDAILHKPGRLTEEEWHLMRQHPACGESMCRKMKSLYRVLPIIRHHHERWDGTGYPDRLAGAEIPLLARILQVVDIYDALTTERPYKRAYSHTDAMRILQNEAESGWRDPDVVAEFNVLCDEALGHGLHGGVAASLRSMHNRIATL